MAGGFEDIRAILLDEGAALVGFADMTAVPAEERKGIPRALSIAVALDAGIVSRIAKGPTPEYFREYARANALLSALAHRADDRPLRHPHRRDQPRWHVRRPAH